LFRTMRQGFYCILSKTLARGVNQKEDNRNRRRVWFRHYSILGTHSFRKITSTANGRDFQTRYCELFRCRLGRMPGD
jgi:hypothetical protein